VWQYRYDDSVAKEQDEKIMRIVLIVKRVTEAAANTPEGTILES
jgi:hypothetical protein